MRSNPQARRSNRRIHSSNNNNYNRNKPIEHGLREIVLIFFCFVGLYFFVSLVTYNGGDPGWSHNGPIEEIHNKGGIAGAVFADIFFYLFGYFAYLFPLMVGYTGWIIYQGKHHDILAEPKSLIVPGIGFILTLSAGCGLAIVHFMAESALLPTHAGGILGLWIGNGLVSIVNRLGATLILLAIFFTGVTLLTGLSWLKLMDLLGYHTLIWLPKIRKYMDKEFLPWLFTHAKQGSKLGNQWLKVLFKNSHKWSKTAYTRWKQRRSQWQQERERYNIDDHADHDDFYEKKSNEVTNEIPAATVDLTQPESALLPALNLLEPVPHLIQSPNAKMLSQRMKKAFANLTIEAEIDAVHIGPVLTNFEVNTITHINTNHLDELAEALVKVLNIKTIDVAATQANTLNVEMLNSKRQIVYFSELLNSSEYQDNSSPLTVALGKDVVGQAVVIDLSRIPHILIAGNDQQENITAIHTLILSILYKSTPDRVRFLLIDNKDLSIYTDLPHLLTPIINDVEQIPDVLRWCVEEMERRYHLMAEMGVRNIHDYNQALENQEEKLYYLVMIISELADFMTVNVEKQVEFDITRLTQKARAAGIHIILATQHPNVNVITGLIKANIPTRIAFKVDNEAESRNLLGQIGAENLLGDGDMLYMTAGTGSPVRVHGGSISEQEIDHVINDLLAHEAPEYVELDVKQD
jgi:S-DNA-T family DNA segregation ATPase FtsK/SpoIIIE